ncbi:MAG: glycosyl hydrolase family 18 protein [Candidatus Omnitrophica bacterium]|nr:glycosyl hydrolase family 18 protein [Candidatus Omnitrophota bacterium]MDD5352918.1 glycosyl hydrolase family 18 protein [Candidatus Omnitrophota bacterium]MDD5550517.1 glycosyl hydrolase family 18 protein [Candidatus Omnitrophota bacterium]
MRTYNKLILAVLIIFISLPFFCGYASLQNKTISAWLAYWDIKNGMWQLKNNFLDKIDEVALFFYALDKDGNIVNIAKDPGECRQVIDTLHQLGIKAIPAVTNDVIYSASEKKIKEPQILHDILSDENSRQKHIQRLMEIIKETNADGIDIDYENMYTEDNELFALFIRELADTLHGENKTLIVTVQQKIEDHRKSWAGTVNWRQIAKYADRVTIMCYNYSSKVSRPGPICPAFWLIDIIEFAKSQIPLEKISIALGFYGYDWSKGEANTVNFRQAKALAESNNTKINWDKKSQSPYFSYSKDGAGHVVWFENEQSMAKKIQILRKYKIQSISLWHMGLLDPVFLEDITSFSK